jgi:hypothetical protein
MCAFGDYESDTLEDTDPGFSLRANAGTMGQGGSITCTLVIED